MEKPTDKECVRRVLDGDPECFSYLVGEYSPRMLNLALGIVRRRDAAEDVLQDAFVKAYEKLNTYRGNSSLSTWLYRIVYTTAVSSLRDKKEIYGDGYSFSQISEDETDREAAEENIAAMNRALDTLSPLDRTLVNLFYIEDKPVREIALICSESESNVKTRLHRIRQRLKTLMKETSYE